MQCTVYSDHFDEGDHFDSDHFDDHFATCVAKGSKKGRNVSQNQSFVNTSVLNSQDEKGPKGVPSKTVMAHSLPRGVHKI